MDVQDLIVPVENDVCLIDAASQSPRAKSDVLDQHLS